MRGERTASVEVWGSTKVTEDDVAACAWAGRESAGMVLGTESDMSLQSVRDAEEEVYAVVGGA